MEQVYQKNVETYMSRALPDIAYYMLAGLVCGTILESIMPKFDEEKDTWVEPYLPNYKIGIIHLAAGIWKNNEDMRLNKEIKIDIKTKNNARAAALLISNNIVRKEEKIKKRESALIK